MIFLNIWLNLYLVEVEMCCLSQTRTVKFWRRGDVTIWVVNNSAPLKRCRSLEIETSSHLFLVFSSNYNLRLLLAFYIFQSKACARESQNPPSFIVDRKIVLLAWLNTKEIKSILNFNCFTKFINKIYYFITLLNWISVISSIC